MHFKYLLPGTYAGPSIRYELTFTASLDGGYGMVALAEPCEFIPCVLQTMLIFERFVLTVPRGLPSKVKVEVVWDNLFSTASRVREASNEGQKLNIWQSINLKALSKVPGDEREMSGKNKDTRRDKGLETLLHLGREFSELSQYLYSVTNK
jgi:hypothetical protein